MNSLKRRIERLESKSTAATFQLCGHTVTMAEVQDLMRLVDGTATRPAQERGQ